MEEVLVIGVSDHIFNDLPDLGMVSLSHGLILISFGILLVVLWWHIRIEFHEKRFL